MEKGDKRYAIALLILNIGSALLLANSIFVIKLFAMQYGIGFGALEQSIADKTSPAAALQFLTADLADIHRSLLESYLNLTISFAIAIIALTLYMNRTRKRYEGSSRRYILLHGALVLVYLGLLLIIHSTFEFTFFSIHLSIAYIGMFACLATDSYLEYKIHRKLNLRRKGFRDITIHPDTPYSNLLNIKENLFNEIEGSIRIIDKHFNSAAVTNLHRLLDGNLEKIEKVTVITSSEMLDSNFGKNYGDLKSELKNSEIDLEVKIMNQEDGSAQHERFILDSTKAFKIPPLNIINKKSEHITKINFFDAKKRFEYLNAKAVKYENFVVAENPQRREN